MVTTIAITNNKGGVGKTTTAATVGSILSKKGMRVLLVDLDSQSNLTSSLLNGTPDRTIYEALKERVNLPIYNIRENLDLVPSNINLADAEIELAPVLNREYILKELLSTVSDNYDFIILDTPPSLALLTINALVAANNVIIPLKAETLPLQGLTVISDILGKVKKYMNPELDILGIVITSWLGRRLNKNVEDALREAYGDKVFDTKIRENIAIAEAPLSKSDVSTYAPTSNGSKDYEQLSKEILNRTNKGPFPLF